MGTLSLARPFTPQPKRCLPTLRGYVHVFNKSTRKSSLLSPQPNALCSELQAEYEDFIYAKRCANRARARGVYANLAALFH